MKPRILILLLLVSSSALFWGCNEEERVVPADTDPTLTDLDASRAPRSKPIPTVESRLSEVQSAWFDLGPDAAITRARDLALPVWDRRVRAVFVTQSGMTDRAAESIKQGGGIVEAVRGNLIQTLVQPDQIERLSIAQGVEWVRPPLKAVSLVTSEGVEPSGALDWQSAPPFGDSGATPVQAAVVDLGFEGYGQLLGTELPQTVDARSFRRDGSIGGGDRHGAAVAEILYDMAPRAALTLVNFDTEVEFGNAVDYLVSKNVAVVNHSVGWFNAGPGDGTGYINDIVRRATSRGILWVNAAGNEAQAHWAGTFADADGDGFLEFGPGDEANGFRGFTGEEVWVLMNWDDWPRSSNDYDLQLYRQNGNDLTLVASSDNVQNGSQDPTEAVFLRVPQTGSYQIAVYKHPGARALRVEIFLLADFPLERYVEAGSIVTPADSPDVVAVGAAYWAGRQLESFSSQGPTLDGRKKPDLTGFDGVSTRSYGLFGFFGTSSASPHVAGALALMKSKVGAAYSNEQLLQILLARSTDAGSPGFDNEYGHGLLYMLP